MNANRLILAASLLVLVSACAAERRTATPPVSAPSPRSATAPAPSPVSAPADWRDAPITAGEWSYVAGPGKTSAVFGVGPGGEALFTLRCERAAPRVVLARAGSAGREVPLTVITTTTARAFTALPTPAGAAQQLAVSLNPRDPLLDAIAFSRGRFAIEAPGLPTLYLPAWPEVGRAIEDCR